MHSAHVFVHLCVSWQDVFMMETQARLHSEITQHCLDNARRSQHAAGVSEMTPDKDYGQADSVTAERAHAHTVTERADVQEECG